MFSFMKQCYAVHRVPSALLLLAILSTISYSRNATWIDELTLQNDAVRKSPAKVRPYYRLGMEHGRLGNAAEAFGYFQKVQELDPVVVAQQLKSDAGEVPLRTSKPAGGLDTEHRMMLVAAYVQQGSYDQAQRAIDDVLASAPDHTDAYLARAEIEKRLGRTDKMIAAYATAIQRGKDAPPKDMAYIGMGALLGRQGKYEQSIIMFREAIKIRPSVEAHNNLSLSYRNMGLFDAARREEEKARMLVRRWSGM